MRINVDVRALVYQEQPPDVQETLSAIDASPLLLKVVNCPVVKFEYTISFDRLRTAAQALLNEYPIIGGRLTTVTREEIRKKPYLKSAAYCINVADPQCGILLCEASADCSSKEINLHAHLANNFSLLESKVVLPPWHQPLDILALLKGKEPLLKLQLTHFTDGGCVLAASMPHLLADSHSSTLLLTRLAQLYRQLPVTSSSNTPVTWATSLVSSSNPDVTDILHTAAAAAAAAVVVVSVAPCDAGPAAMLGAAGSPLRPDSLPLEEAVDNLHKEWSKAALLAEGAGKNLFKKPEGKPSSQLKSLSLDLQSADKPSVCEMLNWLAKAVKDARTAVKRHPAGGTLTSRLLYIPAADVLQLKEFAGAGSYAGLGKHISTNDAISALVWLTLCELRGRPLPGSTVGTNSNAKGKASKGRTPAGGHLGLAINLRQNCQDLQQQLPASYLGNAAWCLHISSRNGHGGNFSAGSVTAVEAGRMDTHDLEMQITMPGPNIVPAAKSPDTGSFVRSLQIAAAAVRGGLIKFRTTAGCGNELLRLVTEQQAASKSVLVRNLSRLAVSVDGFITSWQFPVHNINFGQGPPTEYSCTVRPTPSWQAAVLPSLGASAAETGAMILLTVPASAVEGLKNSTVLKQLVPTADFLT